MIWKNFLLLVVGIFCLVGISASSISVWQGQYYTGTTFNTGTYTFNFTVYDAVTGGNVCFTNTTSLTTGSWGEWKIEQSPWINCNNASKDYFLNINIAGTDQTPRRRLTVSDFLRRDVSESQEGNLIITDNITASYYFGDGSYLTGINGSGDINSVQGNNIYIYNGSDSGNVILAFNETKLNSTIDLRASGLGDNSSWNESYANTLYYAINNSFGYYNITDFNINDYLNLSTLISFNYYNSTDFVIGDYYLNSNPFGYYNVTTLPSSTETDPFWTSNFTTYNSSWTSTYNSTYDAYNSTGLIINWSGDYVTLSEILAFNYYNSTNFNINDYYLNSNPFGFWNNTYATFNETYADTKYLQSYTETDPLWVGNWTDVAFTNTEETFDGNITTEGIFLEQDTTNHRIYDNSTCIIITGDTSTMYIC